MHNDPIFYDQEQEHDFEVTIAKFCKLVKDYGAHIVLFEMEMETFHAIADVIEG